MRLIANNVVRFRLLPESIYLFVIQIFQLQGFVQFSSPSGEHISIQLTHQQTKGADPKFSSPSGEHISIRYDKIGSTSGNLFSSPSGEHISIQRCKP